jgi:hypothetical protein
MAQKTSGGLSVIYSALSALLTAPADISNFLKISLGSRPLNKMILYIFMTKFSSSVFSVYVYCIVVSNSKKDFGFLCIRR